MPSLKRLFGGRAGDEETSAAAREARAAAAQPPPRPPATPPEDEREKERTRRRLEEIRKKREAESMMPVADSRLYQIYKRLRGFPPPTRGDKFSMAVFMEAAELPEPEQKLWLMGFEREVRSGPQYNPPTRPSASTAPGLAQTMTEAYAAWEAISADAAVHCRVSGDGLAAWVFILPPVNGGARPTEEEVYEQLAKQGVTAGIDAGRVMEVCQHDRYLMLIKVAYGQPPVHGVDGDIIDHFKRQPEIELLVRDDGTIDFRDLGWLQTVYEGDVICDVLPPSPPEDGVDVKGRPIPGRPGRWPQVPGGPGTRLESGDTLLVAAIDGIVSFSGQRFRVEPLLIIKGDVDTAIGNLDVVGNVLIHGDILEGFEVKATGNITVRGMIEAATVIAGGSIQVGLGVNGFGGGLVQAGGDVLSKFVESANVTAGGRVICESIVNSVVFSDDAVQATQGRGVIIGGTVTARNHIEAHTIGNRSNRPLIVNLGNSTEFIKERRELTARRDEVAAELEEKEKNIRYLLAAGNLITAAEAEEMEDLQGGVKALKMQLSGLENRILVMNRNQDNNPDSFLAAEELHPPVEIAIGGVEELIDEEYQRARVTQRDGVVLVRGVEGE